MICSCPGLASSQAPQAQRGLSLIEFLVVLFVIALGLLSVAGMIAFGVKRDQETAFRTVATVQAKELAERMHSNLLGAALGAYVYPGTPPTIPCPSTELTARCTAARNLAATEVAGWATATAAVLPTAGLPTAAPSPAPTVTWNETTNHYTLTIGWAETVRGTDDKGVALPMGTKALSFQYQAIPRVEE